jgi:hypothetical protein
MTYYIQSLCFIQFVGLQIVPEMCVTNECEILGHNSDRRKSTEFRKCLFW